MIKHLDPIDDLYWNHNTLILECHLLEFLNPFPHIDHKDVNLDIYRPFFIHGQGSVHARHPLGILEKQKEMVTNVSGMEWAGGQDINSKKKKMFDLKLHASSCLHSRAFPITFCCWRPWWFTVHLCMCQPKQMWIHLLYILHASL